MVEVPAVEYEHLLIGDFPSKTNPPHKPLVLTISASPRISCLPVIIIGADDVPTAFNLEPLVTTR